MLYTLYIINGASCSVLIERARRSAAGGRRGLTAMDHAQTDLCDAASKGNLDLLRELIDRGHNPSLGDYDQRTPLHLAASENQLDAIRFLIDVAKVDTAPLDRWGNTPLDDALRSLHTEAAALLKATGAWSAKSSHRVDCASRSPLPHCITSASFCGTVHLPALLKRRGLPSSPRLRSSASADKLFTLSDEAGTEQSCFPPERSRLSRMKRSFSADKLSTLRPRAPPGRSRDTRAGRPGRLSDSPPLLE